MLVRLGYVAIVKTLNLTASKTITYTNYVKNNDIKTLEQITKSNLDNLKEIMIYNSKNNVHFYRLTSHLIPLATIIDYDYLSKFKDDYKIIGDLIKNNKIRVDLHPDQYCVLNSVNSEVVENSKKILTYHFNILKALGIDRPLIILHVGSNIFGKEKAMQRFVKNFYSLEKEIRESIALENDDKVFNICDVLSLCEKLKIPFVLDYHHYLCNNNGEDIRDYLSRIFKTWDCVPKIHFSSPKNKTKKEMRSHHDYINSDDFISFLNIVRDYTDNLDIMLEAKMKDEALFNLVRALKYKTNYKFIDETSFMVD